MVALSNEAANLSEADKPMYGIHYGQAYERDLDVVEIAKRVRSQLKTQAASKHSPLAGSKISVRISRYSMGQSIDVKVGIHGPTGVDTEEDETDNRREGKPYPWLTDSARAATSTAQQILDAYNFDGSDSMTDYFHVNYYGHAEVYELEVGT